MSIPVYFQAHRGSVDEAPENTLAAFRHAWQFPGAIPETDVRTTADGVLICLHDATLARTTNADERAKDVDVASIPLAQIRQWDAGVRFDPTYAGAQVPTLDELLTMLMAAPNRRLYLEPKAATLPDLEAIITHHSCLDRLIFVHHSPAFLQEIRLRFGGVPTMTWLGGSPTTIQDKFETLAETNFVGITQLQLHLPTIATEPHIVYAFDDDYLRSVQERVRIADVTLQLCPSAVDDVSLRHLVDLGVHWFVTDAPEKFSQCLSRAEDNKG
ncbi:MAG: glycerophosphodiester phosphodiesterase family protein [Chloroflexota bacterium]